MPKLVLNSQDAVGYLIFILSKIFFEHRIFFLPLNYVYCRYASSMISQNIVPIFSISNVTNQNLDYLKRFLNILPASGMSISKRDELSLAAPLFCIDEVFSVPHVCFWSFIVSHSAIGINVGSPVIGCRSVLWFVG